MPALRVGGIRCGWRSWNLWEFAGGFLETDELDIACVCVYVSSAVMGGSNRTLLTRVIQRSFESLEQIAGHVIRRWVLRKEGSRWGVDLYADHKRVRPLDPRVLQ